MSPSTPYAGLPIALATMHQKELAIAPILRDRLRTNVIVPVDLDTDTLGTFTGEVERQGTMGEVATAKARLGMQATGLRRGLASEGTYGPHPHVPFIAAGLELLAFVDDELDIIVFESLIDDAPCFGHLVIGRREHLTDFLKRIGFPNHAVIVRPNHPRQLGSGTMKGIRQLDGLERAIEAAAAASDDGQVVVETDMRAHMNPTRMAALERLASKLCDRLNALCPDCQSPGFGKIEVVSGLPCSWCRLPTDVARGHWSSCVACDAREFQPRTDGLTAASPGQCPTCNP